MFILWRKELNEILLFERCFFHQRVNSHLVFIFFVIEWSSTFLFCLQEYRFKRSFCWKLKKWLLHRLNLWLKFHRGRSSRPEVFCKTGVLRHFTKFTGKHLCQSLFFSCNFIKKETLPQVLSCEFCEISKNTFLNRTPLLVASSED